MEGKTTTHDLETGEQKLTPRNFICQETDKSRILLAKTGMAKEFFMANARKSRLPQLRNCAKNFMGRKFTSQQFAENEERMEKSLVELFYSAKVIMKEIKQRNLK